MTWNGLEQPEGPALLEIARRTVLDDLVPALSGDARFKALMAANAMAIAAREPAAAAEVAAALAALGDPAALCAAIREGAHDPGTDTHRAIEAALLHLAEARCRISAPKAL
jgi:hypothetical protein